ncbi:uncharacterized protein [Ambystoma mexicanum]|uniref:uncharacterized protein isoform X2 n=1 Tax=Ambystoma mexicanum TaxID=8296 RepID=UPI0037E7802A
MPLLPAHANPLLSLLIRLCLPVLRGQCSPTETTERAHGLTMCPQCPSLRAEFGELAAALSVLLTDEQWNKLRGYWAGPLSRRQELASSELLGALLEEDQLCLWDIGLLTAQLEALQAERALRRCRDYERTVKRLARAHGVSLCNGGDHSMHSPGGQPALRCREGLPTSDSAANMQDPASVSPKSSFFMSQKESTQTTPTFLASTLPLLNSSAPTSNLGQEKNGDMCTKPQSNGQGTAVKFSPTSPCQSIAATPNSVTWHQPEQDIWHPPMGKDVLSFDMLDRLQFSGADTIPSVNDDLQKSLVCNSKANDGLDSLYSLQISEAYIGDSQNSASSPVTERALCVSQLGASKSDQFRNRESVAHRLPAHGVSSCSDGDRRRPDPEERLAQCMEALATTDHTAATLDPISVAPSTAIFMSPRQSLQMTPTSVAHNVLFRESSGVRRRLVPEENEEILPFPMNRKEQSNGQASIVKTSIFPTAACQLNAATLSDVNWKQPGQGTGCPPLPTGMTPPHNQELGLLLLPGLNTLSSVNNAIQEAIRGPVLVNDSLHSLHSLQISGSSDGDNQDDASSEMERANSVRQPSAANPSHERNAENATCSPTECPGLWDPATLAAFADLKDFTPEEAATLADVIGAHELALTLNVRRFMLSIQELHGSKEKLRHLADKLKDSRGDVVKAMRSQISLFPFLGPSLPEHLLIKNMKHSDRLPFTTALSTAHPTGHDWRWLAENREVPTIFIHNWELKEKDPAEMVLRHWQIKISEAKVGKLFNLMLEMGREDLAAIL